MPNMRSRLVNMSANDPGLASESSVAADQRKDGELILPKFRTPALRTFTQQTDV
jgi:hypothetical protein